MNLESLTTEALLIELRRRDVTIPSPFELLKRDIGNVQQFAKGNNALKHVVMQESGRYEDTDFTEVWYFPSYEIYVRISGYYSSYDGSEYKDEIVQVFPKEQIITVYAEA